MLKTKLYLQKNPDKNDYVLFIYRLSYLDDMNIYKRFVILLLIILSVSVLAQSKAKLESNRIVMGETLNYKARWGLFTIGSASTRIDKNIHKSGSTICYRIDVEGQTNGLAKLFYLQDKWVSYIDTATFATHKAFRSIREGNYELDEQVFFDQINHKAEVRKMDKNTKLFVLKKKYEISENMRDVVAGFMSVRLIDLSKYSKGEIITIDGFLENEAYKIDVVFEGSEYLKTDSTSILCYKLKPIIPKNKVFNGRRAIDIWFSADKSQTIIRICAKMFIGNILIELQN